jgi:hypothetical protein
MFDYLYQLENELKEYTLYNKIGLKYIHKDNYYINIDNKINILKDKIKDEEIRIKKLYF